MAVVQTAGDCVEGRLVDLLGLLQLMWKQRRITVPLLAVTLAVAVYAELTSPSEFEASGSVLVSEFPPNDAVDPLQLTEPSTIAREVRLGDTAEGVLADAAVSDLSIVATEDRSVRIEVTGAPAADVERNANNLADAVVDLVFSVQEEAGVPEPERIRGATRTLDTRQQGDDAFIGTTEVLLEDPLGDVTNPLRSTAATGRLLEIASRSDAGQQAISEQTTDQFAYEVMLDSRDQAPILEIYVLSDSRESTLNGFDVVVDFLSGHLAERQTRAGVRSADQLGLEVLAEPQRARDVSAPVSRAVAVIFAIGGFLALLAAVLADNLQRRRTALRAEEDDPEAAWLVFSDSDAPEPAPAWPQSQEPKRRMER